MPEQNATLYEGHLDADNGGKRGDLRLAKKGRAALVSRIVRLVKKDGILGVLRFARRWFLYKAHYHLFDRSFERFEAIPTSRGVPAIDLDYDDELRRHAVEYLAAPRLLIHRAIRLIAEPLDRFTFIDIGSGLGRPLLVAAEYPFKSVIGYELSPSLHEGAMANIDRTREALGHRTVAASVHANALEADWPGGSRLFFLFNPFDREFMQRFLQRVQSTADPGTRHYMVFLNLKHPELLQHYPFQPHPRRLIDRVVWSLLSPYSLVICRYDA